MYTKDTPEALQIIEFANIAVTVIFLIFFIRRFYQLCSHSDTFKYQNYFPKMRIVFCFIFLTLAISLLTYNMTSDSYSQGHWYEYLLQGGGGQCINAIILVVQLGVLRFQLNKEQPYSRYHFAYFIYLSILEIARFIFTLLDVINSENDIPTLVISSLIVADAFIQMLYWKITRKFLPQFINPVNVQIDDLNFHTRHIQIRNEKMEKSTFSRSGRKFPFLIPSVYFENGKFKIVLEKMNTTKKDRENRSTRTSEKRLIEMDGSQLTQPFLSKTESNEQEIIGVVHYTVEQIKVLYTICARFPLKKAIDFERITLSELVHAVQHMLTDTLSQEKCYDRDLLLYLELSLPIVREYEHLVQQYYCAFKEIKDKDRIADIPIPEDQNATYFSIIGFKALWIGHHFVYYFKTVTRSKGYTSYPFKKYQEVEEFYHNLKRILKHSSRHLELPALYKNSESKQMQEEALNSLSYLEHFLRIICNDYSLMSFQPTAQIILEFLGLQHLNSIEPVFEEQFFRGLRVQPRSHSLILKNKQSVTVFEFKLLKCQSFLKILSKDLPALAQFYQVPPTLSSN